MTSQSGSIGPTTKRTSRMAKFIMVVLAIGAAVFLSFQAYVYSERPESKREVWGEQEKKVVVSNNEFTLNLYKKILADNPGENTFFSPLSISTALAMTLLGARGKTEEQMLHGLSLDSSLSRDTLHGAFKFLLRDLASQEKKAYVLRMANRIYLQKEYPFLDSFKKSTDTFYGAGSQNVDFGTDTETSRKLINEWVETATEAKIKELLKPGILSALTKFVLVNAIYFKGDWERKFSKDATQKQDFYLSDNTKASVDMMYQKGSFLNGYNNDLKANILELPYLGSDLTMTIILPKERSGLSALDDSLTLEVLSALSRGLKNSSIDVYIPKFKLTCDYNLVDILKSLGMRDLFDDTADLSGMTGSKGLLVSHVIHKAFIDVTEDGSEAAAATAVVGMERAMIPREFRADHPFIYYISDKKTQSIIFIGRFVKPPTDSSSAMRQDL